VAAHIAANVVSCLDVNIVKKCLNPDFQDSRIFRNSCFWVRFAFFAFVFAVQGLFAQEIESIEAVTDTVEAKPSVAQALGDSRVPSSCVGDFTSILERNDFGMAKFMKDLPMDVAKVKLQLKSPFGKPNDNDKTSSGVSVGCIKALPESPAEVVSLLKDISLKMGLNLVVDAGASIADNSIPANVATGSGSGNGMLKPAVSIGLATIGLGAIIYGITKNSDVVRYVDRGDGKSAVDAESSRNMGYGIGVALLTGGVVFYLVF